MEKEYYDSLKAMKRKYDLLSRKEAFSGSTKEEWIFWKEQMKKDCGISLAWITWNPVICAQ